MKYYSNYNNVSGRRMFSFKGSLEVEIHVFDSVCPRTKHPIWSVDTSELQFNGNLNLSVTVAQRLLIKLSL